MTRCKAKSQRRRETAEMAADVSAAVYYARCDARVDDEQGEVPDECPRCSDLL